MTLTECQTTAVEKFSSADRRTLKVIFRELSPPQIEENRGEFQAVMLDQGGPVGDVVVRRLFGVKGPWLGKAFQPLSKERGEGYNIFEGKEGSLRKLPMDTYLGPSAIDGRPAFILDYRGKNLGAIRWLVGELRSYEPGVLLGMGTFGPRHRALKKWRRIIPFALVGPVCDYGGYASQPQRNAA